MANSDARRMANAACCTADGGSTPLLSLFLSLALSLCVSLLPHSYWACPFCACFAVFAAVFRVVSLVAFWCFGCPRADTFGFRWIFATISFRALPFYLPPCLPASPCCHFHMQSACCRLFFCCLLCWHFLCSLAKSQPMSCGIFK